MLRARLYLRRWLRSGLGTDADISSTITVLLYALIALAIVTAAIATAFLTWQADRDANRIAATTIAGAIDRERSRISNETYINAAWDEAADHAYGGMDARWVQSQWGTPIGRGYVIDAAGRTLFGHIPDSPAPPLDRMIEPAMLKTLLARLPVTEAEVRARRDAQVLIGRFGGRPALVGFSPIVREKGPARLDRRTYRIFVDVRALDDAVLAEWSQGFGLNGLGWHEAGAAAEDDASTLIRDWRGRPLGVVAPDRDAQPGDEPARAECRARGGARGRERARLRRRRPRSCRPSAFAGLPDHRVHARRAAQGREAVRHWRLARHPRSVWFPWT